MRTLVLGLGNTLLRDDGVGIRIAEGLRTSSLADAPNVDIKTSSLSGLALLDEILGYDRVVVLDAVRTCTKPVGHISPLRVRKIEQVPIGPSPHYLGLSAVLKWSRLAGLQAPREIQILGIEVKDPFSFDENLSPELEEQLPRLIEAVVSHLAQSVHSRR